MPRKEKNITKNLPKKINVSGIEYNISYFNTASAVDPDNKKPLFGRVDFWERTIRLYYKEGRSSSDLFLTLLHEILHIIDTDSELHVFDSFGKDEEPKINAFALELMDCLKRNGWLNFPGGSKNGKD